MSQTIAFIGQGFIGKAYSDEFEERGISVIRYSLEEPYVQNKQKVSEADIVFVAVPTPTTKEGFDPSAVISAVEQAKDGASVVIKSTLIPGTTEKLQSQFPNKYIFHSPEFLTARTAKEDAKNPQRNIVGYAKDEESYKERANAILKLLPKAPYEKVCSAKEAELIKYASNCFGYTKVVYFNLLYELSKEIGADWQTLREAIVHDPRIGEEWTKTPDIGSGKKEGRGAGGVCLLKDFAAFRDLYERTCKDDSKGAELLRSIEKKNIDLLTQSEKDLEIVDEIYGKERG